MLIDSATALVDNDFIVKLLEARLHEYNLGDILTLAFSELNITGCVHPLVHQKEMIYKESQIQELFENKVLYRLDFSDIFQEDEARKIYYTLLIEELFNIINDEPIPEYVDDILTYWASDCNLGEVHAIATCAVSGCAMFLSDDLGSKFLATHIHQKFNFKITVYNRKEFFKKHMNEGITKLSKKERRALTHAL